MTNIISRIRFGIKKVIATLNRFLTYPFRAIQSIFFSIVYPAKYIYNPQSQEYQELRANFDSQVSKKIAHTVYYDLNGNIIKNIESTSDKYFEAVIYASDNTKFYNKNMQFVIMASGNTSCHELLSEIMKCFVDNNTNVIGFNPMGVGISPGTTDKPDDYKAVTKAIINNLHRQGVPYDHIVLYGQSLSGALFLEVAAEYQADDHRIKVIADRTFGRLDDTAAAIFGSIPVIGMLLYYPVKALINLFRININAAESFNTINQKNPGDARGLTVDNDNVIYDRCSLLQTVNNGMREQGFIKRFEERPFKNGNCAHNTFITFIFEKAANKQSINAYQFINACIQNFRTQMTGYKPPFDIQNCTSAYSSKLPESCAITYLKDLSLTHSSENKYTHHISLLSEQYIDYLSHLKHALSQKKDKLTLEETAMINHIDNIIPYEILGAHTKQEANLNQEFKFFSDYANSISKTTISLNIQKMELIDDDGEWFKNFRICLESLQNIKFHEHIKNGNLIGAREETKLLTIKLVSRLKLSQENSALIESDLESHVVDITNFLFNLNQFTPDTTKTAFSKLSTS